MMVRAAMIERDCHLVEAGAVALGCAMKTTTTLMKAG
tara:strand:+ start:7942 stop:8052 length:111 start_codon:yes stop_codon:yes gene_type:complete